MRAWILLVSIGLGPGCAPEAPSAEGCRAIELVDTFDVPPPDRVDVFAVVDTHADTPEIRATIAERLGAALGLVVGGDIDRDGTPDFDPTDDLALTVLAAEPDCGVAATLRWQATAEEPGDVDRFAHDVAAAVEALPGCARSAPLEAAERVVATLRRAHGTTLVLVVTDEDEPGAAAHLEALTTSSSRRLAIAVIAGFAEREPYSRDFDAWRADTGCTGSAIRAGSAAGLVDAAAALDARGAGAVLLPICSDRWDAIVDAVVVPPVGVLTCHCLPRALEDLGQCTIVEQLGDASEHHRCASLAGRDPTPVEDREGVERCTIVESDGTTPGWIDASLATEHGCETVCGDRSAIAWIDARPEPGARIELRCVATTDACGS